VRDIRDDLINAHAARRFRSEYDYALFEYYRSAKVLAFLAASRIAVGGRRVLDAGCGGGGMPVSLAEEAQSVVGIDPVERFRDAGVRLARERSVRNLQFMLADGMALPFRDGAFDLVLSHAVIEHVPDALLYLRECARVLARGGYFYLSTAPYLSFAGTHLPRLKIPLPLHLLLGRRVAFRTFAWLARRAEWTLRETADENSFIAMARKGTKKEDDLLERVRISSLRGQIAAAGFDIVRENLHMTRTFRRLPRRVSRWLRTSPLTQDIVIGHVQYALAKS
jgi:ubiquinone/menaquinone biosynthesis C-methylase UbiE